jgi:hypothetical protein
MPDVTLRPPQRRRQSGKDFELWTGARVRRSSGAFDAYRRRRPIADVAAKKGLARFVLVLYGIA